MSPSRWTINAPERTYTSILSVWLPLRANNSLEALEQFIQSQKAALERTYADIDRLKELREEVVDEPSITFEALQDRVCPSFLLYLTLC